MSKKKQPKQAVKKEVAKQVELEKCEACRGTGLFEPGPQADRICEVCNGTGSVEK